VNVLKVEKKMFSKCDVENIELFWKGCRQKIVIVIWIDICEVVQWGPLHDWDVGHDFEPGPGEKVYSLFEKSPKSPNLD
jgi:hypothetical protein